MNVRVPEIIGKKILIFLKCDILEMFSYHRFVNMVEF